MASSKQYVGIVCYAGHILVLELKESRARKRSAIALLPPVGFAPVVARDRDIVPAVKLNLCRRREITTEYLGQVP